MIRGIGAVLSIFIFLALATAVTAICPDEFVPPAACTNTIPTTYDPAWTMSCDEGGSMILIYGIEGLACDEVSNSLCCASGETMHVCENGNDDDNDGLIDCEDTDCETWCGGTFNGNETPTGNTTTPSTQHTDIDRDGVRDEHDVCPGTISGTTIVDFNEHPEYAGCSCEQVEATIDITSPCIDFFCFREVLQISYLDQWGDYLDCPDDGCVETTFYDFPPDGRALCINGVAQDKICEPLVVEESPHCAIYARNDTNTTTGNNTTPIENINQTNNTTINNTLPPTTLPPTNPPATNETLPPANNTTPPVIPPSTNNTTTETTVPPPTGPGIKPLPEIRGKIETIYLDDGTTLHYETPETISQDRPIRALVTFGGRATKRMQLDLYKDNTLIPQHNPYCGETPDDILFCTAQWNLTARPKGIQQYIFHLTYQLGDGTPIDERIPFRVTVAEPITITAPQETLIGNDATFAEDEHAFMSATYDEMKKQDIIEDYNLMEVEEQVQLAKTNARINKTRIIEKNKTIFTITIDPGKKILENVTIIEYIPKEIAETVGEITFTTSPDRIIADDPMIMWHFSAVDERIDLSYEVQKPTESMSTTVVTTENVIEKKTNIWQIIIPLSFIPIIIIVLIYISRRNKGEP